MTQSLSVVLLLSTSHAIRAERVLRKSEVTCKLIPVPRHISSQCGVCIRFGTPDSQRVLEILEESQIPTDGVHEVPAKK